MLLRIRSPSNNAHYCNGAKVTIASISGLARRRGWWRNTTGFIHRRSGTANPQSRNTVVKYLWNSIVGYVLQISTLLTLTVVTITERTCSNDFSLQDPRKSCSVHSANVIEIFTAANGITETKVSFSAAHLSNRAGITTWSHRACVTIRVDWRPVTC